MKKFLLAALLVIALVITLVSCSDDKGNEGATTAGEKSTTVAGETATTAAEKTSATTAAEVTTVADATTAAEVTTVADETTAEETTAEDTTAEEVTTEEETTADPAAPILFFDADAILDAATNGTPHAVTAEAGYKSVKLIPDAENCDPYFTLAQNAAMGKYAVIKYKSEVDAMGEFFIGSVGGPHGGTDQTPIQYANTNGAWDCTIVDLTAAADYDGVTAAYVRYDFYASAGNTLEIAWIACFDDIGYAAAYLTTAALNDEILDKTDADAQFKAYSFDTVLADDAFYFGSDGQADQKLAAQDNTMTFRYGDPTQVITFRGWAYFDQAIAGFGMYVKTEAEGLSICKFALGDFIVDRPDVKAAISEDAEGFGITLPLSLVPTGEFVCGLAAQLEDGRIVSLYELKIVKEDAQDIPAGSGMSPDTYLENDAILQDGAAHTWIKNNRADGICGVETAGFRGWCGLGEATIAAYGYAIGNAAPVFSTDFIIESEPGLAAAAGQPNVTRYKITVPVAGLEAGTYSLKLLVKDADGNIYQLKTWGDITIASYGTRPSLAEYEQIPSVLDLGIAPSNGTPVGNGTTFGYKIMVAEGVYLDAITVGNMATYCDPETKGVVRIYNWNTDPATTRTTTPIGVIAIDSHADNADLVVDISKYNIHHAGEYYVEFECTETSVAGGNWTPWGATGGDAPYAVGYVGDTPVSFVAKIAVSTYAAKPEEEEKEPAVRPTGAVVAKKADRLAGLGEQGGPITSSQPFGYKFTLAEGEFLDAVSVINMATYNYNGTRGTFKLFKWNSDYATTVAGEPICVKEIVEPQDNQTCTVNVSELDLSDGTFYFEFQVAAGTHGDNGDADAWTPWVAAGGNADGFIAYVDGQAHAGFRASITTSSAYAAIEKGSDSFIHLNIDDVKARNPRENDPSDTLAAGCIRTWCLGWVALSQDFLGGGYIIEGTDICAFDDTGVWFYAANESVRGDIWAVVSGMSGATTAAVIGVGDQDIDVSGLAAGDYTVRYFIQLADGTYVTVATADIAIAAFEN